jgi:hypothetical protein
MLRMVSTRPAPRQRQTHRGMNEEPTELHRVCTFHSRVVKV